jgi:uncharacterized protein (TIGR01319 family)
VRFDFFVAEIGSTTTVVNAVNRAGQGACLAGQGQAATTVSGENGVVDGLNNAIENLSASLGADSVSCAKMFATSSAAGGLRMSVHGLVQDMTLRAAREAALGAGANLHMCTAGILSDFDLKEIQRISPNLVLLAGGTDYGERETTLANAGLLCSLEIRPPVIYAGNIQNSRQIQDILSDAGFRCYAVENVYPRLDELNIEPTRKCIYRVFEEHITQAPGMQNVREMVSGSIMPTPGAVMECARLLYGSIGDLLVADVGGATTDIHSVSEGSEEIAAMLIAPEPFAKRTVEGDLGVFVNAENLALQVGIDNLERETGLDIRALLDRRTAIPCDDQQLKLAQALTWHASSIALKRHAGYFRHTYGASGRKTYAQGKDLSKVKWLVGTGGALTKMPGHREILSRLCGLNAGGQLLLPKPGTMRTLVDRHYIMASAGVLSAEYPDIAISLLKNSLEIENITGGDSVPAFVH